MSTVKSFYGKIISSWRREASAFASLRLKKGNRVPAAIQSGERRLPNKTALEGCASRLLDLYPSLFRIAMGVYREHVPPGLTFTQFRALIFIARHGGCQVGEVAQAVAISLPAASIAVSKLVSKKLVRMAKSPGDRRRVALWVTSAGKSQREAAWRVTQEEVLRCLESLSPAQIPAINLSLDLLLQSFAFERGGRLRPVRAKP
jgi:DNA-binding MarR family transcriptional regulator